MLCIQTENSFGRTSRGAQLVDAKRASGRPEGGNDDGSMPMPKSTSENEPRTKHCSEDDVRAYAEYGFIADPVAGAVRVGRTAARQEKILEVGLDLHPGGDHILVGNLDETLA